MPTYEYACRECEHHFEVVQSFSDDALTVCPNCDGSLRKVFSAAGIIFKGSGYYVNDSRTAPAAANDKKPSESTSGSEPSAASASESGSASESKTSGTDTPSKTDKKTGSETSSGTTSSSETRKSA